MEARGGFVLSDNLDNLDSDHMEISAPAREPATLSRLGQCLQSVERATARLAEERGVTDDQYAKYTEVPWRVVWCLPRARTFFLLVIFFCVHLVCRLCFCADRYASHHGVSRGVRARIAEVYFQCR